MFSDLESQDLLTLTGGCPEWERMLWWDPPVCFICRPEPPFPELPVIPGPVFVW